MYNKNVKRNLMYGLAILTFGLFFFLLQTFNSPASRTGVLPSNVDTPTSQNTPVPAKEKEYKSGLFPTKPSMIKSSYSKTVYEDSKYDYKKVTFNNKRLGASKGASSVIMLMAIGGKNSYGSGKTFDDLFETLSSMNYPKNSISYGISVGDSEEFENIKVYFENYFQQLDIIKGSTDSKLTEFISKVTLISAPFIDREFESLNRENRKDDHAQRLRRRAIARARNFVLLNSLDTEQYTFFIDADIIKIEHPEMLNEFINSDKDIVVPRITKPGNNDYDRNSWRGERTKPTEEQLTKMDKNEWESWDYVPRPVSGKTYFFYQFVLETDNLPQDDEKKQPNYLIELDSVGGCILFAKSIVYKQGVVFPPNYIIGTTWDRLEGYDGIETEGVCYIAKSMGYSCWGMPNLVGVHSND
ncbi:uncharacterized protein PRCAT00004865001 [Priceomyces carsonii]|uniref:uncharacterized protein n=1 Tax=Priceomyces carsonii TaxID=28549 RepID=UPI002ED93102|nr:unnamed protein product [Priceomyces carsonii]